MSRIEVETKIKATADICFELTRDLRVQPSIVDTDGDLRSGQTVSFESMFMVFKQILVAKVVEFDRPRRFVDEMIEGRFKSFVHIHEFEDRSGGTLMRDTLIWESPLGILGRIFDKLILERHLRNLVSKRNERLKQIAETT